MTDPYTFHAFSSPPDLLEKRGKCAAIGFFDGVHRGHLYLIDQIKAQAAKRGLEAVAVTFENHPKATLCPSAPAPRLLTSRTQKLQLLREAGLSGVAVLGFSREMAQLSSEVFMKSILWAGLRVECLLIGFNHRFGADRSAGYAHYRRVGEQIGMEVLLEKPFFGGEEKISSSFIRKLLLQGDTLGAARCLGRPFRLEGIVVEGQRVGTLLGFPTANLRPEAEMLLPECGVYAVKAHLRGQTFGGMLNIGHRPTLSPGGDLSVEVHLFDFPPRNLYGEPLSVDFLSRVRDEERFPSLESLRAHLREDALLVKKMLSL